MKKNTFTVAMFVITLLSGCSTITNGSTETIAFSSQEEDSKIFVDGKYYGKDQTQVVVDRGEQHTVVAQKKGCKPTTITTDYDFQFGKSLFLNFFIDFGLISIPTDLITGSAWKTQQPHYNVTPQCD